MLHEKKKKKNPPPFLLFLSLLLLSPYLFVEGSEYKVETTTKNPDGSFSASLSLSLSEPVTSSPFEKLHLDVIEMSNNILRVRMIPINTTTGKIEDRYQVEGINIMSPPSHPPSNPLYSFSFLSSPFCFNVTRSGSTTSGDIWEGSQKMAYEDQYLQFGQIISNDLPNFYGLGERVNSFSLNVPGTYTMWNEDQGGALVGPNLYGTHPLLFQQKNDKSSAVFFLNSNAMAVDIENDGVTWKSIGGVIDIFFIVSDSPDGVIQAYTEIVGKPYLPPYWSLGFHQCRWGYRTIQELNTVLEQYEFHGIPLDGLWSDIDYMRKYLDFTFDPERFPLDAVNDLISHLHDTDRRYVVIVDPGISNTQNDTYLPYLEGEAMDVFVKQFDRKKNMVGNVWPGDTVFPDFLHPETAKYWFLQIERFLKTADIDGIWIDMNEISSKCPGGCPWDYPAVPSPDLYDNPPYNPLRNPLNLSTISISSSSKAGLWYNLHNLYGFSEQKMTKNALEETKNERSFTLTRSTFAGSGRLGAHWLGDNFATWAYLKNSIAGILNMQMFAIPQVGADICGFNSETTEELCTRWQQLGSMYPFSRNHNAILMRSQEPYAFSSFHLQSTIKYLHIRYSLLPYFYTLFFRFSYYGECCVWRPLFFQYPDDSNTYSLEEQFLVGNGLMVAPVLSKGATTVSVYFPDDRFFDFYSGKEIKNGGEGDWAVIDAPLDTMPIFLRGGVIVPGQLPGLNTVESRKNDMILHVSLNSLGLAEGVIDLDDGISLNISKYDELSCMANEDSSRGSLTCATTHQEAMQKRNLGIVYVNGATKQVKWVEINGKTAQFSWEKGAGRLVVAGIDVGLESAWKMEWGFD